MKTPDIKQNPHPMKRYEVMMTIDGAPGPFDSIEMIAQYDVVNRACVPLQPISGAQHVPSKGVSLTLTRINDTTYGGMVYIDFMQDEDYFGIGICHWKLTTVSAYLHTRNLTLPPDISLEEVISQKKVSRYFSSRSYLDSEMKRVDTGNANRSDFKEDSGDTFSVTLFSKENL